MLINDLKAKGCNPYTDEFHINIYEYEFDTPIEKVVEGFCNLLKIFR